jgi:hypothetical protein
VFEDTEKDWSVVDFEDVYGKEDMKVTLDSYAKIPTGIRPLLQGQNIHWVMTQAAIRTKCEELSCVILLGVNWSPPP